MIRETKKGIGINIYENERSGERDQIDLGAEPSVGGHDPQLAHNHGVLPASHAKILHLDLNDVSGNSGHGGFAHPSVAHVD